jgi:hypothetical protein
VRLVFENRLEHRLGLGWRRKGPPTEASD